jgi:uncharacterized lipoprotein
MRFLIIIRLVLCSLLLLGLFGCGKSVLRDRSQDYVKAQTCPSLKIPANLQAESFNQEYEFPDKS